MARPCEVARLHLTVTDDEDERAESVIPDAFALGSAVTGVLSDSATGAGDEGGDDVGGVPVQGLAAAVVTHRGARVRMAGGFLDIEVATEKRLEGIMAKRVDTGGGWRQTLARELRNPGIAADANRLR